jgi:hypothetical protein
VLVLEADHVGFGASGRNGGWVSALWPVSPDMLARRAGREGAVAQLAALRDTVDEVGRVDAAEGFGSGFTKGGALIVARTPAQEERAQGVGRPLGRVGGVDDVAWMPVPPASASPSPSRGGPPSPRTAPGCTRGGSSTGWRGPCAGSVGGSWTGRA